ncbi:MAG: dethiobiotin synthase [Deltaproteobacteria bacterium]|nr:dethiobiotin synthase [Deltaproteobacteria bacterium]
MNRQTPRDPRTRRVVILGTGTGIGKTEVTAGLTTVLRARYPQSAVAARKPVETGIAPTRGPTPPPGSDARRLHDASTPPAPRQPHPLCAYREAVSPHLAARLERRRVALDTLPAWLATAEQHYLTRHATMWMLLETAGAALSPLSRTLLNVDLAVAANPDAIVLVAPDSLGVLHDVRATLTALAAYPLPPPLLVLSAARTPDASTGTNARELARIGLPRPVAVLGHHAPPIPALAPLARALDALSPPRRPGPARAGTEPRPTYPRNRRRD